MRIDAVIAEACFVYEGGTEGMRVAERHAAVGIVLNSVGEVSAIERVVEGRGNEAGLVLVAETAKEVILVIDLVVDADVEVILALSPLRFGEEIVTVEVYVG